MQSSDLESRKQHLSDLETQAKMLAENSGQWRGIIGRLQQWNVSEMAQDYVSNALLELISDFISGKIDEEACVKLQKLIRDEKKEIDELRKDCERSLEKVQQELDEVKTLINDMQNNRKTYSPNLRQAKDVLEHKLSNLYGKKVQVNVFADLFDVVDEEWKNAIEGRMGNLKYALVTEPEYAHNAAETLRDLKRFEEVTLINSNAIVRADKNVLPNSLYEAVTTTYDYVDACLKHYLGRIIKCRSVAELEKVREGVTPDCYSYSNYMFRHLRQKDYTTGACIGSTVSKKMLLEYKEKQEKLSEKQMDLSTRAYGFREIMEFETLSNYTPALLVSLSKASETLEGILKEKRELEEEIRKLSEGEYRLLEERKQELEQKHQELKVKLTGCATQMQDRVRDIADVESTIRFNEERLEEAELGYVPNEKTEQEIAAELQRVSGKTLSERFRIKAEELEGQAEELRAELNEARMAYIAAYPSGGFTGGERSNEVYIEKLNDYRKNYEPQYQQEFDQQCGKVYQTLRENIVAKIHNDIREAVRHKNEINRMLRDTNFADSVYQIKIEAAQNEDGQFYEMLTAKELDTKNVSRYEIEGQLSFGEDEFYQKYEKKLNLLMEKFMPPRSNDEASLELSRKEMEKYADYRTYLHFNMYEQVEDENGIRENYVDEMAGRDSGGEGQNPKYVALLAGFAMLYMDQNNRDSKIKLVLLDEAFSKMDQKRSEVCLKYARKLNLQLIVCVPDERLSSLIRNVDCIYGFKRDKQNEISMMHIDKGNYLSMMEG